MIGEVFKRAIDIGLTELGKENGVPQLVAKLRRLNLPQQSSEASLQFQTCASEMPQAAARERQHAAKKMVQGIEETVRAAAALVGREHVNLPKKLAIEGLKEIARQVNLFLKKTQSLRASDLIKMLQDTVDVVTLKADDTSVPPVALMHWSRHG